MSDAISDKIEEAAQGPKKVAADGIIVEQHSLIDQIAADKHLASKQALRSAKLPVRFAKISPPGAI